MHIHIATCIHCPNGRGEYLIIPAHLCNVPIHYTMLKNSTFVQQGCCKVVTKLSQGRNSFKIPKLLYTRLRTGSSKSNIMCTLGSSNLVTTLCNNLWSQDCHNLVTSLEFFYGLFLLVYLSVYSALLAAA